jgi:transposase-like protein
MSELEDWAALWAKYNTGRNMGRIPESLKISTVKALHNMAAEQGVDDALTEVCRISKRRRDTVARWIKKYGKGKPRKPKATATAKAKASTEPKTPGTVSLTVNGIAIKGSIDDITALLRAGL